MIKDIIQDLSTFSDQEIKALAKYYSINSNIDRPKLLKKIAGKIIKNISRDGGLWNNYCKTNYIPDVIDNTRAQLLKEIAAGKSICDLVKNLPRIGKSSTSAAVYDYSPTSKVAAVIKMVPKTAAIEKDVNLSQLLSVEEIFPFVYLTGTCGSKYYIVMEKLGPTLGDLIMQKVPTTTIKKVIRDILDAIDIMLEYDIVHTDLKPDNIMLRCTGPNSYQTVIIDFDLVNNPNRELSKYKLFDVYDFMRRLHNLPELEALYPAIHRQVTEIYLKLLSSDPTISKIANAETFKKFFQ